MIWFIFVLLALLLVFFLFFLPDEQEKKFIKVISIVIGVIVLYDLVMKRFNVVVVEEKK